MEVELKDLQNYEWMWKNNGKAVDGKSFNLSDALSTTNAPVLLPKVISNIVREAAEPLLIGTSLLQRINYSYGQNITFPAVGALTAADLAEGQEYPERSLQMGGATVTASIGKVGLAVKVTDEMIRYSQFDVIGMHLRAAGRALARHKEQKIFNYIGAMGTKVFDNVNPTKSIKGVTTGRALAGNGNGSVTMDDVFDAYAQVVSQGFIPDTLLMHPLTWTMFVKDATLRSFVLANGGGTFFATWTGSANPQAPWASATNGGMNGSIGQNVTPSGSLDGSPATPLSGMNVNQLQSAPQLPGYMNMPFRIIVSPYMPYDVRRKLTDIYMFDSRELGVLIVDEEVTTEEFDDPRVDIKKIKLRERYGIGILNDGQGIAVMKNVHVVPNEIVLPAQAHIDVSGTVGTILPYSNVLG